MKRDYCIFTADQTRHVVKAASLRSALRSFGDSKGVVIAAIEMGCMPTKPAEDRPFIAVLLRNPHFVLPEA